MMDSQLHDLCYWRFPRSSLRSLNNLSLLCQDMNLELLLSLALEADKLSEGVFSVLASDDDAEGTLGGVSRDTTEAEFSEGAAIAVVVDDVTFPPATAA